MNNEDYQLEEMENSAVNKSAMAKRAAMGAGLLATGAATAYGAEQLINGDDQPAVESSTVDQPDLTSGATAGAVGEGVAEQPQAQPEPEPQVVRTEERVDVYHHYVPEQPKPEPQPEPDPDIEFNSVTHLYDDEGNLVGSMDSGTLDGKKFLVLDEDADGYGDELWYDANGDGKMQDNEVQNISGAGYAMGKHGGEHHDFNIETGEEIDPYIAHNTTHDPNHDSLADIENDFKDEKSGEEYYGDLAQNNPDYNNRGNVDPYQAGSNSSNEEPVLAEDPEAGKVDDPYLAQEDDTLIEEDSTEDYVLSEDEPTEDDASEDLAYENGDEIENDLDDTADEDLAYNDDTESDIDDNVDDTDQYDIV